MSKDQTNFLLLLYWNCACLSLINSRISLSLNESDKLDINYICLHTVYTICHLRCGTASKVAFARFWGESSIYSSSSSSGSCLICSNAWVSVRILVEVNTTFIWPSLVCTTSSCGVLISLLTLGTNQLKSYPSNWDTRLPSSVLWTSVVIVRVLSRNIYR